MKLTVTNTPSAKANPGALRHSRSHRKLAEERRPLMFMGARIWFKPGPIDCRPWAFWKTAQPS